MSKPDKSPAVRDEGSGRAALRTVRSLIDGGRTVVIKHPRTGLQVAHRPPTQFELLRNTAIAVYTVDTEVRQRNWTVELDSADDPYAFSVAIHVTWQVVDPVEAVRSGLRDPGALCRGHVERQLRKLAAQHRIEQSKAFTKQAAQRTGARQLANGVSLLRCSVTAQPAAAYRTHQATQKQRTWTHQETMLETRHRHTEAAAQHKLDRQKVEHEGELERARTAHELRIQGDRVRFNMDVLESGINGLLALDMATGRPEVRYALEHAIRQDQITKEQAYGLLTKLADNGTFSRSDLRGLPAHLVAMISGGGGSPGLADALPAPAPHALPPAATDGRAATRAERRRRDAERDAQENSGR